MQKVVITLLLTLFLRASFAQLIIARDTITVIENGSTLKMPWANGLNYSNLSNIDLNYDGKLDVVAFDRVNLFGVGKFRCFIQTNIAGTYSANPMLSYSFPPASY